jgi:hypothetical protein
VASCSVATVKFSRSNAAANAADTLCLVVRQCFHDQRSQLFLGLSDSLYERIGNDAPFIE